jgi:MFS family permease
MVNQFSDRADHGAAAPPRAPAHSIARWVVLFATMPTRAPTFAAFRHRNFRLFFVGYVISLVGVWMQRVAQSWLVLDLTGSAFYVGLADALGSLPILVFALYAGAVADRVSKRHMVMLTQTAAMLVAFAFAAMIYAHVESIGPIIVLAALMGVATAFDIPARQSFFVEIVGREDLPSAIALNSSAFNATRLVGPALAGLAIGAFGVAACFVANGASYLAVLAALIGMRVPPFRPSTVPASSAWRNINDGLRYVTSDARVRLLLFNIAAMSVFGLPVLVLLPVLAKNVLGRGAQEYGWMMSAVGGGALVGALAVATFASTMHKGRVIAWSATAFGALVIALSLAHSVAAALAILTLLGAAMITTTALTNMLLQTLAPDELRGRVVAAYTFSFVGMAPLGSLLAGTVAQRFGVATTLAAGGLVTIAAALALLAGSPAVRETR